MSEYPKVAIAILSRGFCDEFEKMLNAIDYPNKEVFVESSERDKDWGWDEARGYQHARQCASVRNKLMRRILVESDAQFILSLDDDVYCPPNVLSDLVSMKQPVSAAWVPVKRTLDGIWIAGTIKWNEPDVYIPCRKPRIAPDQTTPFMSVITPVDCSLWHRQLLEIVSFRAVRNVDRYHWLRRREMYLGECACAGEDLRKLGVLCAMSLNVICEHRREVEPPDHWVYPNHITKSTD